MLTFYQQRHRHEERLRHNVLLRVGDAVRSLHCEIQSNDQLKPILTTNRYIVYSRYYNYALQGDYVKRLYAPIELPGRDCLACS